MPNIYDDDSFLVNRDDDAYQVRADDLLAELQDDDLMLVNREDVTYKATGADIKDSLQPKNPPVFTSVTLTEQTPDDTERFQNQKFDVDIECEPLVLLPIEYSLKPKVTGSLAVRGESDEITDYTSIAGADYSAGTVDNPPLSGYGWEKAFDGVLSGTGAQSNGLIGSGTESTLTISPAVDGTKIELLVAGNSTGASYTAGTVACINGTALTPINSTAIFTAEDNLTAFELTGTTSLSSITAGDQNLVGVRVNDVVLIDGASINSLTFASDKDFEFFSVGSRVTQDSSYIAQTSSIISISPPDFTIFERGRANEQGTFSSENVWTSAGSNNYSNAVGDNTVTLGDAGKYYFEAKPSGTQGHYIGVALTSINVADWGGATGNGIILHSNGSVYAGGDATPYGFGSVQNKRIGVELDTGAKTIRWSVNGTFGATFDLTTETSWTDGTELLSLFAAFGTNVSTTTITAAWRVDQFTYDIPQGAQPWSSPTRLEFENDKDFENLRPGDSVKVTGGADAFKPVLYTGNSGEQDINVGFAPDLVWIKERSSTSGHALFDAVRGPGRRLRTDNDFSETSSDSVGLTAFNSDGFTVGFDTSTNEVDQNYVAWCWKASGSAVTNNDGDVESVVRAGNGLSIATFTSTVQSGQTQSFGHGLNAVPGFVLFKSLSTGDWYVYHKDLPDPVNDYLLLNTSQGLGAVNWGALPTSTTFSYTSDIAGTDEQIVAYLFAEKTGSSAIGAYVGASAPLEVNIGFRPAVVILKNHTGADNWTIVDDQRPGYQLWPNGNESERGAPVEITDTGFRLTDESAQWNNPGFDYVYAAFSGAQGGTIQDLNGTTMSLVDETGFDIGATLDGPDLGTPTAVVSASDSASSTLTLSDISGRFASNAGRNVFGEYNVPLVTVTPTTSEITDVEYTTLVYSDSLSNSNGSWSAVYGLENAFDGDPSTLAQIDSGSSDATITWNAASYNLDTANNKVVVRSATTNVVWEATGTMGTQTTPSVSDPEGYPLPDVGILQTLRVIGPAASLMYIKYDGDILTDNTKIPTLTFADNKDLNVFDLTKPVTQDSGHTPTTSAITGVAEITAATTYMVGSNVGTNEQLDDLRKTLSSTTPMVECPVDAPPSTVGVANGNVIVYVSSGSITFSTGSQSLSAGTMLRYEESYDGLAWGETKEQTIENLVSFYPWLRITLFANGNPLPLNLAAWRVTSVDGTTTLTLQDDTDLENFRVGDSIDNRGVSPIRYGWFEPDAAYPSVDSNVIAFETATNLDLTSTAEQVLTDSTLVPPGADPTGWQEHLIVDMLNDPADVLMTAYGNNWQVNGSDSLQGPWENLGLIDSPNRQSIRALAGSKRYALISYVPMPTSGWESYNFKIEIQQSWIDAFINGNNYLFAAGVVSQINTDNNQLILSSAYGTWNANQIAYGPDTTPATGAIASIDAAANTMTLSVSDESGTKRWIANQGKSAVGPTTQTEDNTVVQYLTIDPTGKVVAPFMQTADPGYQPVLTGGNILEKVTLDFPAVMGNGLATDTVLPEGTKLCVDAFASNFTGSSEALSTDTGACVIPVAEEVEAEMYGLRFDRNRKAYLQTSNDSGATQQFTVSAWVKVTGDSSNKSIYTSGTNSAVSGYFRIYMNGSNEIVLETTNSSVYTEYNTSGASSIIGSVQWFHLVVSVDTTQAALADQFKVYVNGTYFADTNSANAAPQNASILQSPMGVGVMYSVDGSDINWMDGYLSDVYYVDGQALEPETFGDFFEGKWAPIWVRTQLNC